ncbi:MAG: hypothetical protein C5B43_03575 [Verrucomicrobia bacterium]|nr:MAG: hypothetical protein C5B43_03575 [Verrucomicrobiota bacterium]
MKSQKAFSLLEILTVITILAILAAIFIPIVGKALESARKSTASNNLRQIALAYHTFLNTDNRQLINKSNSLHDFIAVLAEKTDLNDPNLWIIKDDPLIENSTSPIPTHIISFNPQNSTYELNPNFKNLPLSISLVKGIPSNSNPSTTPIAWTRGLLGTGHWSPTSVYAQKGGFIAFLDGHVKWYSNLSDNDGQLTHYITHKPTSNIYEALPPHASVLD